MPEKGRTGAVLKSEKKRYSSGVGNIEEEFIKKVGSVQGNIRPETAVHYELEADHTAREILTVSVFS